MTYRPRPIFRPTKRQPLATPTSLPPAVRKAMPDLRASTSASLFVDLDGNAVPVELSEEARRALRDAANAERVALVQRLDAADDYTTLWRLICKCGHSAAAPEVRQYGRHVVLSLPSRRVRDAASGKMNTHPRGFVFEQDTAPLAYVYECPGRRCRRAYLITDDASASKVTGGGFILANESGSFTAGDAVDTHEVGSGTRFAPVGSTRFRVAEVGTRRRAKVD